MIIIQTPLRVSFFGGGTDLPDYYLERGGCVLSSAIDKYIFVNVKRRFDEQIRIGYTQTELVDHIDQIRHNLIREAMRLTDVTSGVEITTMGDIPSAGSGLGSSSTVTVGVLHALHSYRGEYASPEELAQQACKIELELLGKPIGVQDQLIAAFGGFRFMEFGTSGEMKVMDLQIEPNVAHRFNNNLMLFYTGITRKADTILHEQQLNIQNRIEILAEMKHLAYIAREQLERGNIDEIGHMLHYGWTLKKRMASRISNPQIDALYKETRKAGAMGGKITGAGGGGFFLIYCPEEKQDAVRSALSGLRELPFKLEHDGAKPIFDYPRSENGLAQKVNRKLFTFEIGLLAHQEIKVKDIAKPPSFNHQPGTGGLSKYAQEAMTSIENLPFADIQQAVELIHSTRLKRNKIYIMGNGGSASTATHFACDLYKNVQNPELPDFLAYSLADNLAAFSAYANDDGYENVFRRALQNSLEKDDLVIAISTSGNSENVIRATEFAKSKGVFTIGFTGFDGGKLSKIVDLEINISNHVIEQVEDLHLLLVHMIVKALKTKQVEFQMEGSPESFEISTGEEILEHEHSDEEQSEIFRSSNRKLEVVDRAEAMYLLQRELMSNRSPEVLLGEFLKKTLAYLQAESGSLLLMDERGAAQGGKVCYKGKVENRSAEDVRRFLQSGLANWVVTNKTHAIVGDTAGDPRWIKRSDGESSGTAVAFPLIQSERVIGILSLKRNAVRGFTNEEIYLLAGIALVLSMHDVGMRINGANPESSSDLPFAG